jgi:hypothetical protein
MKRKDLRLRRSHAVVLVVAGLVIGVTMTATPAMSHVGGTVSHLWGHLKPKADARYLPGGNLPAGKTIRGSYDIIGWTDGATAIASDAISFGWTLRAAPLVQVIHEGGSSTAQCPGTVSSPQAAQGYLCIYERDETNTRPGFSWPEVRVGVTGGIATRYGTGLNVHSSTSPGFFWSQGTWAVKSS